MTARDSTKLAAARALLKAGRLDAAVPALVVEGAVDEAARALADHDRLVDAANVLLDSLGVRAREIGGLRDPHLRARATRAAALLRQAGMLRGARQIEQQLERRAQELGGPVDDATLLTHRHANAIAALETTLAPGPPSADADITRPTLDAIDVENLPTGRHATRSTVRAPEAFEPGALVDGRYELGELLGRGGMARVFRARDRELSQDIAIKVFEADDDPTLLARFKQELLSSRQIAHPNVVRLFDIGTFAGRKYLTLELLIGQDLKQRIAEPILVSDSLGFLTQACRGLDAAHRVGVIHRDIKPQNLFITTAGEVKIMDFGIAKLEAAAGLTKPGVGVGTPEYMAPEQIKDSRRVLPATDLYAIGITAYRLCTGRVPFVDKDLLRLLKRQLHEAPVPPTQLNPRLPPQLEAVILRLLEKKPERRYQAAAEVAEAFAELRKLYGPAR